MSSRRPVGTCLNCGEPREMAAHGLCFTCYRAASREQASHDDRHAVADRHQAMLKKEAKRLLRGFNHVMNGLADLRVTEADVMTIRNLLNTYLEPITSVLVGRGVNSEHVFQDAVHINKED